MTEQEKKIIETCGRMLPHMSEKEKDGFLNFTEGMAFMSEHRTRTTTQPDPGQRVVLK